MYEAIKLVSLCKQLNTLPNAGGLLDQDGYYIWLFSIVLSALSEKEEKEKGRVK